MTVKSGFSYMKICRRLFLLLTAFLSATSLHGQKNTSPLNSIDHLVAATSFRAMLLGGRKGGGGPRSSPGDPFSLAAQEAGVPAARSMEQTGLQQAPTGLQQAPGDGLWDGILVGAAIGSGAGALVGYSRKTSECKAGCSVGIGMLIFAPAGAVVGYFVDRSR